MKRLIMVVLLSFSFVIIADDMKEKLNTIKFQNVSFKNASYHTVIRFLFMNLCRMSDDENPNQIHNYIHCLPVDDFNTRITIKNKNISLKDLLDKICKQAKLTYDLQGNIILIGKTIAKDDNFKKIKSFNDIKIEHAEFEDCSLSQFFNSIVKLMNKKRKKNNQIILNYIKESKASKKKKSIAREDDFDMDFDDEDIEEEVITLIVDDVPAGTLISHVCKLTNLKYTIDKNKITIQHTQK